MTVEYKYALAIEFRNHYNSNLGEYWSEEEFRRAVSHFLITKEVADEDMDEVAEECERILGE